MNTKFYYIANYFIIETIKDIAILDTDRKLNVSCQIADDLALRAHRKHNRITDKRKNIITKINNYLKFKTGHSAIVL